MTPAISVIVPTHNRADTLRVTLAALANQSIPSGAYEIIVVGDGCTDATPRVVAEVPSAASISYLEQPARGAAAARNRGAAAARAPVLLFLDDDQEAVPHLLQAYLDVHRSDPAAVALGYFPTPCDAIGNSPFARLAKLWWDDQFRERARPSHRFTFKDFCTGNVSLAAELFRRAGGFDESVFMGEDYELGVRLLDAGARFRFVPEAFSLHHDRVTLSRILSRARQEGSGHVTIVARHPELFRSFNLHQMSRLQNIASLWKMMWRHPVFADCACAGIRLLLRAAAIAGSERTVCRMARLLRAHAYWTGVRSKAGSFSDWTSFQQRCARAPRTERTIDVHLENDLDRLDVLLETHWVDSVNLFWRGTRLGCVEAIPGAERLAGRHLRDVLLSEPLARQMFWVIADGRFQPDCERRA